jgi:hypothetical protein
MCLPSRQALGRRHHESLVWHVVKQYAAQRRLSRLAPHQHCAEKYMR